MQPFARLLERLVFTRARNAKLRLMAGYFAATPDPDRGWALAALAGELEIAAVTPSRIRGVVERRVHPVLFALSYDFVGDLAETVALIWPEAGGAAPAPRLSEVVERLAGAGPVAALAEVEGLCDRLGASERLALIKLATGGLRVGVSARLARTALAEWSGREVARIEELMSAMAPPYEGLFRWLEGGAEPEVDLRLAFRPMMLANPLDEARLEEMDPAAYAAEWKWDGIRIEAVAFGGERRLGRKQVSAQLLADCPAHLRLYDILHDGTEDVRALPFEARRERLEAWLARNVPQRTDLSAPIPFRDWAELAALRAEARDLSEEGLMLKRRDSAYVGGRPVGPWFKWKRDPLTADCVLVYAQRGHGKRSSYYSDFTFAAWRDGADGPELVPVGKAYSGYTDEELVALDRWVRRNTVERYGPVRAVAPGLVVELAFDAVQRSTRHKSGIAMRFPRVRRIRWDKPVAEADRLDTLEALIPEGG